MEVIKDEELWRIAKKRASFKKQLLSYIIVNGFLWALWYITAGRNSTSDDIFTAWPIWSTLGWGIGLTFSYFGAYHNLSSSDAVRREYDKLKNEGKG
jgi:hypothetical protein